VSDSWIVGLCFGGFEITKQQAREAGRQAGSKQVSKKKRKEGRQKVRLG
jgi:hypothetical protein